VLIRPATRADAAGIRVLCEESLPLDPDAAELAAILRASPGAPVALVAETAGRVTGIACGALRPHLAGVRGHVDLLAVAPRARGVGTGARLLGAAEEALRSGGATEIWLGQGPPVWLWPGVDPRYTAMICLAERSGYRRCGEEVNMAVDLGAAPLGTDADERRLAASGIIVRRAAPAEAGKIAAWLRQGPWGELSWPAEAKLAFARDPPGCHIAVRAGAYIAFACHGCNRRTWFGPMGTLDSERQHGVGTVLLRRCLADLRAAGHRSAQIGWTGPVHFYARAVGARIDRMFWSYKKALGGSRSHRNDGVAL
jgi:mycothiol synthase